jgi:integrase
VGAHKSLIREAIERLDAKMALHRSRFAAKQARREEGDPVWTFSTEQIHSHGTRRAYQEHVLHFVNWCREQYRLIHLDQLDARADELASNYLTERLAAGPSPYTLHAERSAQRLFFTRRDLAADVALPHRRREAITRSRRPVTHDRDFQPANWQPEIHFLASCGLRRSEALALRVGDICSHQNGQITILVPRGKGGRSRIVPVLPGSELCVLTSLKGRNTPAERVFARLPSHLDIHALRRSYAQSYYRHLSGRELPLAEGRLRSDDYDHDAALLVSQALGHHRVSVCLHHYLR